MKQTAVEFLVDSFIHLGYVSPEILEKAKEMEKKCNTRSI